MKENKTYKLLFFASFLLCIFLLNNCGPDKREDTSKLLKEQKTDKDIDISKDKVGQMISSVPNPVEMSSLLQKSDIIYSHELLNPEDNIDNYKTNFKKALNLGVYGTNLVYMNIYDRTVGTLPYLRNVRRLADDLRIGKFFDYETLNKLSESSRNVDSVLYITNRGFDDMTRYLIEQNRSDIAVLIAYGTWIESLYLATHVKTLPPNKDLIHQRIGEQKLVLHNMLLLLNNYRSSDNEKCKHNELFEDLLKLKDEFDKVSIEYIYQDPIMKNFKNHIVVVDKSTSKVNINQETIDNIAKQVKYIRNKIIK